MKTIQLINRKLATVFVAFVLLFASCDNPIFDPGGDGGGNGKPKDPPPTDCTVKGTMVRVPCGFGIYGDLWIKTDNGKYLQPCEQSFMPQVPVEVKEGDQVAFGYTVQRESLCDHNEIRCMAALPIHQSVTINCMQVVNTKPDDTCPKIVIDHTNYGGNGLDILESTIEGHLLKLKVRYGGCKQIESKDFALSWKREISKSSPVQTTLQLYSAKVLEEMVCSALFTTDLCYDLTPMLKDVELHGPINMHIGNKTLLLSK